MSPEKFKSEVQAAYSKAIANTNSWRSYSEQSHRIFDAVAVFGREAGVDLVETSIEAILQEAIQAAAAKRTSLSLVPGKVGKAAFAGMVETLKSMTGLPVSERNGVITLAWAKDEPQLY
ncbi:hypothetical protein DA075_13425 [Methylobacterium currus]|uniref:Uncharacterized protein n=1 Tax=Methylobacterium currus TaxID=2051553 RepID=A0A2R4WJU3_9HYPH|nr:hypothetical protein [Methylobacterium currus]AWB21796.1 hypothetical protein DA075_13425 [Methylobacterium currus]